MDSQDPKHTRAEKPVSPESYVRAFPIPSTPEAGEPVLFHSVPPANPATPPPDRRWRVVLSPVEKPAEAMGLELLGDAVLGSTPEQDPEVHVNLAPWQGDQRGVSRRHALLRPARDKLFIMDLGSTNGTHVNGAPLTTERVQALQPGDLITLGRLHLRVKSVAQTEPPS